MWLDHPQIQEGLEIHTASGRHRKGGATGHAHIPPPHRPKRQRDSATGKCVYIHSDFETYNMLTVADWLRVDSGGPWLFVKVSFCLSVGEEQNKEE